MDHFERSSFLAVLTFEGYFGNYEKFVFFLEKPIFGQILPYFLSFKTSLRSPKTDFIDPPNVLNKLLSRNLTLTKICEVNKFNLVTYFSLYKYQPRGMPHKTKHKKTSTSFGDFAFFSSRFLVSCFLSSFFLIFWL